MAIVTQTLRPATIVSIQNFTPNNVSYIQDDPSTPDSNNIVPINATSNPRLEVSFDAPNGTLTGTQTINLYSADPNWIGIHIEVFENGTNVYTSATVYPGAGKLNTFSFDASILTDLTGAGVTVVVVGHIYNGMTISSVNAVSWAATVEETVEEPPPDPEPTPQTFTTEFSEYTIGAFPSDWTEIWATGSDSIWKVTNDDTADDGVVLQHTATADGRRIITWNDVGEISGDFDILVKWKVSQAIDGDIPTRVMAYASGVEQSTQNAYQLDSLFPSTLRIGVTQNGTYSTLSSNVSLPFMIGNNTWYWYRFRKVGSTLSGKIWEVGTGEPTDFMVIVDNTTLTTGSVGLGAYDYPGEREFDSFIVGINGATVEPTAPTEPTEPIIRNGTSSGGFNSALYNGQLFNQPAGIVYADAIVIQGEADLSSNGIRGISTSSNLTGQANLTSVISKELRASTSLIGAANITSIGIRQQEGSTLLNVIGQLSSGSATLKSGQISLLNTASFSTIPFKQGFASSALLGIGLTDSISAKITTTNVEILGNSIVGAVPLKQLFEEFNLIGESLLDGTSSISRASKINITNDSSLNSIPFKFSFFIANLEGNVELTAESQTLAFIRASLIGAGNITAYGIRQEPGSSLLLVNGQLSSIPLIQKQGKSELTNESILRSEPFKYGYTSADLIGSSTISIINSVMGKSSLIGIGEVNTIPFKRLLEEFDLIGTADLISYSTLKVESLSQLIGIAYMGGVTPFVFSWHYKTIDEVNWDKDDLPQTEWEMIDQTKQEWNVKTTPKTEWEEKTQETVWKRVIK